MKTIDTVPQEVLLDEEDAKKLTEISTLQEANSKFVETVAEQGEKRQKALIELTREFWMHAKDRYNIDLENIAWDIGEEGLTIVPKSMRL